MKRKISKFQQQIYNLCSQIPAGKVSTYKAIAQALELKAYQAVGMALSKNPFAPQVPCHRVVASNGSLGGFKGKKNGKALKEKIALLAQEGVVIKDNQIINFNRIFFQPKV